MDRSQWYIGAPNGVVLCVDRLGENEFAGRMYHAYSQETLEVEGIGQLLFELERFFDSINFPYASTNGRSFRNHAQTGEQAEKRADRMADNTGKKEKIMSDEELLKKHGDLGTFIIRVQQRQNSSWQGRITWMDKDETIYFRSVWEMIKLIASALDKVGGQEEPGDMAWSDNIDE